MSSGVPILAAMAVLAAAAAPSLQPALARSQNFEVYAQGGAADARTILFGFERLHAYFLQQTGFRLDQRSRVRVIAFRSRAEYEAYRLRPAADAYYVGSENQDTIVMTAPADGDIHVAAHEYAHFVLRANSLDLPPWLNEGLAEVFAAVRVKGKGETKAADRELPARAGALRKRTWMPLGTLVTLPADSPLRERRDTSDVFYAESWALADLLTASPDYRPGFSGLVAALRGGVPSDRALVSTYGKPLEEITADLHAWVAKRRISAAALPAPGPNAEHPEISEVSPAGWRAVLADLLLITGKFQRAASAFEDLVREDPANPDFQAALATLALHQRDWARARQNWRRALDLGLHDADACYRYALLADAAGLPPADIRPALERAVAARPGFDNAHYLLAHLDNNTGRYESAVAHLKAMHTVGAARQFAYWTALSYALDELGRHEEAKAAATEARRHATTAEERARAAQLAEIADTDLAVRFARDGNGNSRLVTTRAPRDDPNWNPFIEPDDHIRRVEGKLRTVNCDGTSTSIVVENYAGWITLTIADPSRVQMRNAPAEFTCGPQPGNAVRVVYAVREGRNAAGVVRSMEFP